MDQTAGGRLAPKTAHPSPLAQPAVRRYTPEVGAVCGKAASTDLCGGREATRVPTATGHGRRCSAPCQSRPAHAVGRIGVGPAEHAPCIFVDLSAAFTHPTALLRSLRRIGRSCFEPRFARVRMTG